MEKVEIHFQRIPPDVGFKKYSELKMLTEVGEAGGGLLETSLRIDDEEKKNFI